MPTNDERREVAARLREEAERHCDGFDPLALMDALGIDMDAEPFCDGFRRYCDLATFETWNRLADLIETDERTCRVELIDTGNEAAYEHYEHIAHCHSCHHEFGYVLYNEDGDTWQDELPNFCPNCGAEVKEEE